MSFSLWSQRLMFVTCATDRRRHCDPQMTLRRSLRGDTAVDEAAIWPGPGEGEEAGVTADDVVQSWWLKMVSFAWRISRSSKPNHHGYSLLLENKTGRLAAAWGLALGLSSAAAAQQGSCRVRAFG